MKSVAILGCGPAGLMVAHAAMLSGWDFRIYSRKVQSQLYGAQYLHQPIPALNTGLPQVVRYRLMGTPEQYRRKVYGDDWDGTTSPEDFMETHHAWDLRGAYEDLWWRYSAQIYPTSFSPGELPAFKGVSTPDIVISTVPRKIWAQPGDVFESTKVWALGDTELPRVEHAYRPEPFSVMCDGRPHVPWYRVSNIFGHCTMEWPYGNYGYGSLAFYSEEQTFNAPAPGCSLVEKPLRHNSKAASDFIHLGRYGAWQKGILTSDVFFDAMKVLADDRI